MTEYEHTCANEGVSMLLLFFFLCAKVYICSWSRYDKFLSNTRTGYAKADTKGNEICAAKIRKCLVRLPP